MIWGTERRFARRSLSCAARFSVTFASVLIALITLSTKTNAQTSAPLGLSFQTQITDLSDVPIASTMVAPAGQFKLAVVDATNGCALYIETYTASVSTDSRGFVSKFLGSGSGVTQTFGASVGTFKDAFKNNINLSACAAGGPAAAAPGVLGSGAGRNIVFTIDGGTTWSTPTPVSMGAAPYAYIADLLDGISSTGFVQVNGAGVNSISQTNIDKVVNGNIDVSLIGGWHNHDSSYVKSGGAGTVNLGSGTAYTTGNLGVGTTTPGTDIEIKKSASTELSINTNTNTGVNSSTLSFYGNGAQQAAIKAVDNASTLQFFTGGVESFRINNDQSLTFWKRVLFKDLIIPSQLNTAQIAALAGSLGNAEKGALVANTQTGFLQVWDGVAFQNISTGAGGSYVGKAGDSMTGALNMAGSSVVGVGAPVQPADAANKVYVDTYINSTSGLLAGTVKKSADSMTGQLNMTNSKIIGLASPTLGNEAVNKSYADANYLQVTGANTVSGQINMSAPIVSSVQQAMDLAPYGVVAGNTGEIRFRELAVNGTNYVGFKAPDDINPSTVVWKLPPGDGGPTQVLQTDGSGNLSWVANGGAFTGGTLSSALGIISGTPASPGLFFAGDTNTGMYRSAADNLALVTGGATALSINAGSEIGVGSGTAPSAGDAFYINNPGKWGLKAMSDTGASGKFEAAAGGVTAATLIVKQAGAQSINMIEVQESSSGLPQVAMNAADRSVRFYNSAGNNYVGLKAPGAFGASINFTLPIVVGSNGDVLSSNGAGGLVWAPPGGVGSIPDGTQAAPALAFASNAGTGIFRSASGSMGFSSGTTAKAYVNSVGFSVGADTLSGTLSVAGNTGSRPVLTVKRTNNVSYIYNLQEWLNDTGSVLYSIENTGTPSANSDLVSKQYVSAVTGNYVKITGDTVTGTLATNTGGNPGVQIIADPSWGVAEYPALQLTNSTNSAMMGAITSRGRISFTAQTEATNAEIHAGGLGLDIIARSTTGIAYSGAAGIGVMVSVDPGTPQPVQTLFGMHADVSSTGSPFTINEMGGADFSVTGNGASPVQKITGVSAAAIRGVGAGNINTLMGAHFALGADAAGLYVDRAIALNISASDHGFTPQVPDNNSSRFVGIDIDMIPDYSANANFRRAFALQYNYYNTMDGFVIDHKGRVGIGTFTPSSDISLGADVSGPQTDRKIAIERRLQWPINTGTGLLITAGGASPNQTDLNGGSLTLESGVATGIGTSSIVFRTPGGIVAPSSDRPMVDRLVLGSSGIIMTADPIVSGARIESDGDNCTIDFQNTPQTIISDCTSFAINFNNVGGDGDYTVILNKPNGGGTVWMNGFTGTWVPSNSFNRLNGQMTTVTIKRHNGNFNTVSYSNNWNLPNVLTGNLIATGQIVTPYIVNDFVAGTVPVDFNRGNRQRVTINNFGMILDLKNLIVGGEYYLTVSNSDFNNAYTFQFKENSNWLNPGNSNYDSSLPGNQVPVTPTGEHIYRIVRTPERVNIYLESPTVPFVGTTVGTYSGNMGGLIGANKHWVMEVASSTHMCSLEEIKLSMTILEEIPFDGWISDPDISGLQCSSVGSPSRWLDNSGGNSGATWGWDTTNYNYTFDWCSNLNSIMCCR